MFRQATLLSTIGMVQYKECSSEIVGPVKSNIYVVIQHADFLFVVVLFGSRPPTSPRLIQLDMATMARPFLLLLLLSVEQEHVR
jgi:hypothetical protein